MTLGLELGLGIGCVTISALSDTLLRARRPRRCFCSAMAASRLSLASEST